MKLNNRLDALEQKQADHVDACSGSKQRLWGDLVSVAARLGNETPDEGWLKRNPGRGIAAMALLEHLNGESTPALWAKVKELSGSEAPVLKLFASLEAMHGAD